MKTILVPLDGSALAEQVLPYVRALAPILGMRVQLLRVFSDVDRADRIADSIVALTGMGELLATQQREQLRWETLREHAQNYLLAHATQLETDGLAVQVDVQGGHAAEVIIACADHNDVGLIAMATHGYSGLKRWTLGSVTDKVVHASATPVLVVRASAGATTAIPAIRRVLVPLDGSDLARQALPLATELATQTHAELMLLKVVVPFLFTELSNTPASHSSLPNQLFDELGQIASELKQYVSVAPLIVSGPAAETIVDQAAQRQADLIVMATHGYSGIRRWAIGSVADKVLHTATTPVLVVRAQASAE